MTMLKGLDIMEQINEIVNDFVKPFGVKAKLGTDFCYTHSDSTVYYSFAVSERNSETWNRWITSLNPHIHADMFLTCLLHEVGHHMTEDNLTVEEQRHSEDVKSFIETNDETQIESNELDFMYYALPDEYAATQWALNYISCAVDYCSDFWEKLKPLVLEFYKVNEIEVEENMDCGSGDDGIKATPEAETYEEIFGVPDPEEVEEFTRENEEELTEEKREEKFSYEMPGDRHGTDDGDACEGADDPIDENVCG